MRRLGIIGGLGPAATAHLFSRIVHLTDAACDAEHLDITVLDRPEIPSRIDYLSGASSVDFVPVLIRAARDLERLSCDVAVIACITAHAGYQRVVAAAPALDIIDLPAACVRVLSQRGFKRVGVLASSASIRVGVLQDAMCRSGIEAIVPNEPEQSKVDDVIYHQVKAGREVRSDALLCVAGHLQLRGAQALILGCTELSLLGISGQLGSLPAVDALEVAAQEAIVECGGRLRS